jgi:hypothetical protein
VSASSEIHRFPIRVDKGLRPLFAVLGMAAGLDWVEVGPDDVGVTMGWAFRATIPRTAIVSARRRKNAYGGLGVHGWRGRWLVNGSWKGIVELDLGDGVRSRVLGVPMRLTKLLLSLDDPEAFLAAVGP